MLSFCGFAELSHTLFDSIEKETEGTFVMANGGKASIGASKQLAGHLHNQKRSSDIQLVGSSALQVRCTVASSHATTPKSNGQAEPALHQIWSAPCD